MADDWYLLVKPEPREPGRIVTQAFTLCVACRKALEAVGGPKTAICGDCVHVACVFAEGRRSRG